MYICMCVCAGLHACMHACTRPHVEMCLYRYVSPFVRNLELAPSCSPEDAAQDSGMLHSNLG